MGFPERGTPRDTVFAELEAARADDADWRGGRIGIYVHYAGDEVLDVAKDAYRAFFSENALGPSAFPSLRRLENDILSWTAALLHGEKAVGTVTSGGTESIFLAMQAARDHARSLRPELGRPVIVAPETAHPAFNKAAHYLEMTVRRVPMGKDFRADVGAMRAAIDSNTITLVGSAPTFPHGAIDPIAELGEIAAARNLWFHVDACVGGFLAPFVKRIGYAVPAFDFALPAVSSMSADLHKYGFTAKGASTVLFRDAELRRFQTFDFNEWPRGRYVSSTFTGTRPGGAIAAAWAVMRYLGAEGYERLAGVIMRTRDELMSGIRAIDGFEICGSPDLSVFAFTSPRDDMAAVAEAMRERGWFVSLMDRPRAIHMGMLTPAHAPVVATYLGDLRAAVEEVRQGRVSSGRADASYGS